MAKKGRAAQKFVTVLGEMLDELHQWDSTFDPAEIAEAVRANDFTPAGVSAARRGDARNRIAHRLTTSSTAC